MPLTIDFVLNDILKILPSIPFVLISAQSIYDDDKEYVFNLKFNWLLKLSLYTENALLINDFGGFEESIDVKTKIISVLEEKKLRINEVIIVFDSEYQILDAYHFDKAGNVTYTFNSTRFSKTDVAIEYDLFATYLDDKECVKDYWLFVEGIRNTTAAECVLLVEPSILKTIRKRKLERVLK